MVPEHVLLRIFLRFSRRPGHYQNRFQQPMTTLMTDSPPSDRNLEARAQASGAPGRLHAASRAPDNISPGLSTGTGCIGGMRTYLQDLVTHLPQAVPGVHSEAIYAGMVAAVRSAREWIGAGGGLRRCPHLAGQPRVVRADCIAADDPAARRRCMARYLQHLALAHPLSGGLDCPVAAVLHSSRGFLYNARMVSAYHGSGVDPARRRSGDALGLIEQRSAGPLPRPRAQAARDSAIACHDVFGPSQRKLLLWTARLSGASSARTALISFMSRRCIRTRIMRG